MPIALYPGNGMDIAVVGAGVTLTLSEAGSRQPGGSWCRGPDGCSCTGSSKSHHRNQVDDDALDRLVAACSAACNPIDDKRGTIEYRTKVAGVLGRRAAKIAFQRAGGA